MVGSNSGSQRRDTMRRTFLNRDQFKTTATVLLLVVLPSRCGGEMFWDRVRASVQLETGFL